MRVAPSVAINQRFFLDFSTASGRPSGTRAVKSSKWRENYLTKYEPGVQTGIINSILARPSVGTLALISS